MKRLLGGGRMKWAHPVAKFWLTGVTVFALAFLGTLLVAQSAHAAPASSKWLNRFYIVDNTGQNYFDSNTYDDDYSYREQNPVDGCPDTIKFVHLGTTGGGDPFRNANFFYDINGQYSINKLPNGLWKSVYEESTKYTSGAGGSTCGTANSAPNGFKTTDNFPVTDANNRRVTFYRNNSDQIINFKSNTTFSRKGDFKGIPRYFRDDEVGDTNNSCPDVILLHAANINTGGESIFGRGEIAGSSMLYGVVKDGDLKRTAESYDRISEPNAIGRSDCKVQADSINGRKGGTYGISAYDDNAHDNYYLAGGLNDSGSPATGGDEDDDAIIIFVGSMDNVPKDSSNVPITNPGNPDGDGDKTDQQVCKGGALGWVICPIISGIQAAIDLLRDTMQYFLVVNPLPIGSGPIYDSWNNIRNFSNIAFAIAFFIIIFSQATSVGISNYGIKRLLPRLVLIAIATNLSYFMCSFLIDFFNVLGIGVTNLFAIANGGAAGTVNVTNGAGLVFTTGLTAGITWAFASGTIVQIFPLIATAFIGFFITFVILVARQALIILLVVFSPIAFVAGLLPGTQSWFRRWFDTFVTLLVMYPMVMALFAAARLASSILSAAAGA